MEDPADEKALAFLREALDLLPRIPGLRDPDGTRRMLTEVIYECHQAAQLRRMKEEGINPVKLRIDLPPGKEP